MKKLMLVALCVLLSATGCSSSSREKSSPQQHETYAATATAGLSGVNVQLGGKLETVYSEQAERDLVRIEVTISNTLGGLVVIENIGLVCGDAGENPDVAVWSLESDIFPGQKIEPRGTARGFYVSEKLSGECDQLIFLMVRVRGREAFFVLPH